MTSLEWPKCMENFSTSIDLDDLAIAFEQEKERLFINPLENPYHEIDIEGLSPETGGEFVTMKDWEQMQSFLQSSAEMDTRFILVNQKHSWAHIDITEECAKRLFSTLEVMPEFWNVLCAFGEKQSAVDESYGGIFQACADNLELEEYCYLIKHVEEKQVEDNRSNISREKFTWCNRQIGVYHQRRLRNTTGVFQDTYIIVKPSVTVKRLLRQICNTKNSGPKPSPELVHTMIANTMTTRWKKRVGQLEAQLEQEYNKAKVTSVEATGVGYNFTFENIQRLSDLRDAILRLDGLLEINRVVFDVIQSKVAGSTGYKLRMETIRAETGLQRSRLATTLQRLDCCITLVRDIMDIQRARIAQDDNRLMAEDAKTSKSLTVLAGVFIPASFAAQVLSLGYIKFGEGQVVQFTRGIFGFLALTALCSVITVLLWLVLQRGRGTKDEEQGQTMDDESFQDKP